MTAIKRSSLRLREEGEEGGTLGSSSQPDTMFVSTKLSWKGKYERVFAITRDAINTIDPKEWRVTNTWRFELDGVSAAATEEEDVFQLLFKKGNKDKDMKFSTAFRAQLIGEILRLRAVAVKEPPGRLFPAKGLTRQNQKRLCSLRMDVDSIVLCNPSGDTEWRRIYFPDISEVGELTDVPGGLVFIHLGKPRLFAVDDGTGFLTSLKNATAPSGLNLKPSGTQMTLKEFRKRSEPWNQDASRIVASFLVYKQSTRHAQAQQRTLLVTHSNIIQRDSATYTLKSIRPLTTLLGIVRKSGDEFAQDFALEFSDGAYCDYRSTSRDQLLAVLIDMAQLAGNSWVSVTVFPTSYSKRAGRIIPNLPPKDILAMEACYFSRFLAVAQRTTSPTAINVEVVACAQDIAAQFSASGITYEDKVKPVNIKTAITSTAQQLTALKQALRSKGPGTPERLSLSNQVMIILRAMKILCSTREGYKGYLHLPLVVDDLTTCMFDQDEGIAAAAMEVGACLVRPWNSRHTDEDTMENRRLLMTPKWSAKVVEAIKEHSQRGTGQLSLPHLMHMLESALCKPYANQTDKGQWKRILEVIADSAVFMFGLFRSKTLSLTTRMALLMKTIMENCLPSIVSNIQEAALLEGVFLRHLFIAIFSESVEQQQISRYLVELWADGFVDAEELMHRVFPAGMVRRLGSSASTRSHVAPSTDSVPSSTTTTGAITTVSTTAVEPSGTTEIAPGLSLGAAVKESRWHSLWGMVTADHSDIDLLWSSQQREELREAFDLELRRLDTEIDLGLSQGTKIAWNFLEFYVSYPSLQSELCVCGYYLSKLLSAVKQKQPLGIYNPQELFERLYSMFLQLSQDAAQQSVVLQCMTAVMKQECSKMTPFTDIPFVLSLLDSTRDASMRDLLLLFVRSLAADKRHAWPLSEGRCVDLLVELACEAHQSNNQMATPLTSGVLAIQGDGVNPSSDEAFSAWFIRNKEGVREGPFTVAQLSEMMKEKDGLVPRVREDTPMVADGCDDWAPLKSYRFLRWRLLLKGQGELTPRRVALICLEVLLRISSLSPARDSNGHPVRPLPRAKANLSSRKNLSRLVQLLLTSDPQIVDSTCRLLEEFVPSDRVVLQKFYLTGVFYFALAYGGSNFGLIASLLKATHLEQAYRTDTATGHAHLTLSQQSYLGVMLPESCISVLTEYPSTAFAETFTGNFDNPEVIWKYDMRKHLMCMLWQHIGELPRRLRANPYEIYDYIPLPAVVYQDLENELWCHNFYLRTLCDLTRYADWPIKKPIELLQAVLDAWRDELQKEPPNQTESDARRELEVDKDASLEEIRQAYKRLARMYHPDKNPDGRERFERVQNAYDLLSAARMPSGEPDLVNVALIIKTHVILYQRYGKVLAPLKYPGYPMLLNVVKDTVNLLDEDAKLDMFENSWNSIYLTCSGSSGNAEEFVGDNGINLMATSLNTCLSKCFSDTPITNRVLMSVIHICKLLPVLTSIEVFRNQIMTQSPFVWDILRCLSLHQAVEAVTAVLEFIAQISVTVELQNLVVSCGGLWRSMQLLFGYDYTLDEESARANMLKNTQAAKNVFALMAAAAIGRLAGYLQVGNLPAPVNQDVCIAVSCMLTGVLALRLKHIQCGDLLTILNTNVSIPTIIWNDIMRAELTGFLTGQLDTVPPCKHNATAAHTFSFTILQKELYVGQLYIRVYNEQPQTPLENPAAVGLQLLKYLCIERARLHERLGGGMLMPTDTNNEADYLAKTSAILEALVNVVTAASSVARQLQTNYWEPLIVLMTFLQEECVVSPRIRAHVLKLLELFAEEGSVTEGLIGLHLSWRILHLMRSFKADTATVFVVLRGLVTASSSMIAELVRYAVVLDIIEVLNNADNPLALRASAMGVLASMCSDLTHGPTTLIHTAKIIPRSIIDKSIQDSTLAVQMFDSDSETPELIWNNTTRKELAAALRSLRGELGKMESTSPSPGDVYWKLADDYFVKYTVHGDEMVVGGVYLRLFLKDPQFELKDSKAFLEAMLEKFFTAWSEQKQETSEKYMNLVSSIVCILKTRPSLTDHVSTLGYIPRLVNLLLEAQGDVRLVKETAIIRLLHEFAASDKCVERFASVPTAFEALMKVMRPLPHPLAFCLDTVKLLLERNIRVQPSLVPQALECKAIPFLLGILEGTSIDHVDDPVAAKVHAIGCLQNMSRSPTHGEQVNLLLDQSTVWTRYKNQKHDLFISRQQKKDYFLTDGAATTKLLITDRPDHDQPENGDHDTA